MSHISRQLLRWQSAHFVQERSRFVCVSCRARLHTQSRQLHATTSHRVRKATDATAAAKDDATPAGSSKDAFDISAIEPSDKAANVSREERGVDISSVEENVVEGKPQQSHPSRAVIDADEDERRFIEAVRERDPTYTPALTAEDLEWVGGDKWINQKRDPGDRYQGYGKGGTVQVERADIPSIAKAIIQQAFAGETVTADTAIMEPQIRLKIVEAMAVTLGRRPSDHWLSQVKTVGSLSRALHQLKKPKKVSQLLITSELATLPNVQVRDRRQTKYHDDQARGRLKLIEQALLERDLPVHKQDVTKKKPLT